MGSDTAGNRYYENRVDYAIGQHRWVEPGDIHNFDSSSIPPEWHGWMTSMNDAPPVQEEEFIAEGLKHVPPLCVSNAPDASHVGHQEEMFHFHNMHNQSQVRSRGYGIGNPIVGLPPHAKDSYYTQPGSPYNDASIRPLTVIGDLDEKTGGGRPFKSTKWKERLMTPEEKEAESKQRETDAIKASQDLLDGLLNSRKAASLRGRGGTASK